MQQFNLTYFMGKYVACDIFVVEVCYKYFFAIFYNLLYDIREKWWIKEY